MHLATRSSFEGREDARKMWMIVSLWHKSEVPTGSELSAFRGRPEVIGAHSQNDAIDPHRTWWLSATQGQNFHEPFFALTE
jgi:hypothetical protein